MFRVYHSNQLDLLKDLIVKLITIEPLTDPFVSEQILVQSIGISKWLQVELAKKFNIASNINFISPATFIWHMFVKVFPDLSEENRFTKDKMTWKLMHRLPFFLKEPSFFSLHQYLKSDYDKRKLYQLSARIADLFDQYIIYRSDWLTNWESGKMISGLGESQKWQAALWRDLVYSNENQNHTIGTMTLHANFYNYVIKKLQELQNIPSDFPRRVFICGISTIPPIYLQIFEVLGKHIDINLLFNNPCCHYWGDIQDYFFLTKSGKRSNYLSCINPEMFPNLNKRQLTNPLLASWGKLGRDLLFLLSQRESLTNDIDAFVEVPADNLLHSLQADLLHLNDNMVIGFNTDELTNSRKKQLLDPNDRSIVIRVCHSIQRETEVLQDHLLALMESNSELKLRDIIVMVSDIDLYTPFIQAVFGGVSSNRYLPFTISDRSILQEHPIILVLLNLLNLSESHFTSEDILSLLEVPALAQRFSVNENTLCVLRRWLMEFNVRWDFNANLKDSSFANNEENNWQFILQCMLHRYVMKSDVKNKEGIFTYNEPNNSITEIMDHFTELLSSFHFWCLYLSQERTLKEWKPLCRELIDSFFIINQENEEIFLIVATQWNQIIEQGIQASYNQPISLKLLLNELRLRLEEQRINHNFLLGSINFCKLIPMRSIPFKIVCLLGMNDGIYPRTSTSVSFNLMQQQIRKGDRSYRDDDRYAFLEALISAQHQFYVSYIGCSIKDNTKSYPSVMVKELIDYIAQSFYLYGDEECPLETSEKHVKNYLQIFHSRTPFAPENFRPGEYSQSFAVEWVPPVDDKVIKPSNFIQPLRYLPLKRISLKQFLYFWHHPVRVWFQQRLGIIFKIENNELINKEPFVLNNLERYKINLQLLNALIKGQNTEQLYTYYRNVGNLPYGEFGKLFWEAQIGAMHRIAINVINQKNRKIEKCKINLKLNDIHLTGCLTHVQKDGILRWLPRIVNMNDVLLLWLEHLVYCSLGRNGQSCIYGLNDTNWTFQSIDGKEALLLLEKYVQGYKDGLVRPLILPNQSISAWIRASFDTKLSKILEDKKTQKKALTKLFQAWYGTSQVKGENSDFYLQRINYTLNEYTVKSIISAIHQWYLPMLHYSIIIK